MRDASREPTAPAGVTTDGSRSGTAAEPDAQRRDELALAESAARGDGRAFEEIVRRHAGLVLGLGRRLLGSREAAEDLLQDVFVKVHRSLPGYRGEASLKSWIARVTVNSAHNRRRDERRRLRLVTELRPKDGDASDPPRLDEIAPDGAPSPERHALSAQARGRIESALADLPDEFREALLLRDAEGLSYDEIATALGISVGTVKSRIARGRARLQEALGDLVGGGWP